MTGPEPFTHPTQLTSRVFNCGHRQLPSVQLYVSEPLPVHPSQELATPLPYKGAGSSAGRLSMKELTEKTARPGPGSPYPGGDLSPKSSIVER